MQFNLPQAIQLLERTPAIAEAMLSGLEEAWLTNNEGGDTWNATDVIAHLIHGEKTDWMPRINLVLTDNHAHFTPYDMDGYKQERKGKTINQLLDEFKELRKNNLLQLQSMAITNEQLTRTGQHPALGTVTLQQLLAAWVVHDQTHIYQLSRLLAKQYEEAVGPWKQFMGVLGGKR
jgi:uncharacterized damage-inducible protein DinB